MEHPPEDEGWTRRLLGGHGDPDPGLEMGLEGSGAGAGYGEEA